LHPSIKIRWSGLSKGETSPFPRRGKGRGWVLKNAFSGKREAKIMTKPNGKTR